MKKYNLPIKPNEFLGYESLHQEIVKLLEAARFAVTRNLNAVMTITYWKIGHHIVELEQKGARQANYGEALIQRLSIDLTKKFGRGFSPQNLWQMRAFYSGWPLSDEILQTASGESRNSLVFSIFPLPFKR